MGATLAVGGGVLAALSSDSFTTWFRRNVLLDDVEWPYRTRLVVEGFPAADPTLGVPRGDRLTIRARAEGEVPPRVRIRFAYGREELAIAHGAGGRDLRPRAR